MLNSVSLYILRHFCRYNEIPPNLQFTERSYKVGRLVGTSPPSISLPLMFISSFISWYTEVSLNLQFLERSYNIGQLVGISRF